MRRAWPWVFQALSLTKVNSILYGASSCINPSVNVMSVSSSESVSLQRQGLDSKWANNLPHTSCGNCLNRQHTSGEDGDCRDVECCNLQWGSAKFCIEFRMWYTLCSRPSLHQYLRGVCWPLPQFCRGRTISSLLQGMNIDQRRSPCSPKSHSTGAKSCHSLPLAWLHAIKGRHSSLSVNTHLRDAQVQQSSNKCKRKVIATPVYQV